MEVLVGAVLPVFIDLVNKKVGSHKVKYVVALVVSAAAGAALHYTELSLTGNLLGTIGVIFAEAQTVYKLYWEKSEIRAKTVL